MVIITIHKFLFYIPFFSNIYTRRIFDDLRITFWKENKSTRTCYSNGRKRKREIERYILIITNGKKRERERERERKGKREIGPPVNSTSL